MNQRGFISLSLQTWAIIILVIATMAAFVFYSRWLYTLGYNASDTKWKTVSADEKARRQHTIGELALALGKAGEDLYKQRQIAKAKDEEIRQQRKGQLHAYVPRDTTCLRAGFVRYIDAAARGVPLDAGPGAGPAEALAGVGTDDVADVVARNYDKYADCKAAVAGILKDFDAKRGTFNKTVGDINQRVRRVEKDLQ